MNPQSMSYRQRQTYPDVSIRSMQLWGRRSTSLAETCYSQRPVLCPCFPCPSVLTPPWVEPSWDRGKELKGNSNDIKTQEDCYLSHSLDIGLEADQEKARFLLTCFSLVIFHLACLSDEPPNDREESQRKRKGIKKLTGDSGVKWPSDNRKCECLGETGRKGWEWAKLSRFFGSKA